MPPLFLNVSNYVSRRAQSVYQLNATKKSLLPSQSLNRRKDNTSHYVPSAAAVEVEKYRKSVEKRGGK